MEIIKKVKPCHPYNDELKLSQEGKKLKHIGKEILRESKVAVVILAGGQGTRLGTDEPKGCFELPGIKKTLYQIHAENIKNVMRLYGCTIPIILMTSKYTHEKTKLYFEQHSYFGLKPEFVIFQEQPDYMCFNLEDEPLKVNDEVITAPNGNGAIFLLFRDGGVYERFPNIEYFNVIGIDNVLARVADPIFIGFILFNDFDCVSKSVTKIENESVGVFVQRGENIITLEYSEIMGNVIENDNNKLIEKIGISSDNGSSCGGMTDVSVFNQGNICNHIFSKKFMIDMASKSLPVHKAYKKIPYLENGKFVKPENENGYKCELFIFDAFVFTTKNGVMNVPRVLEFSPVKNGIDSENDNPTTAVNDLYERSRRMLLINCANVGEFKILVWPSRSVFGENLEDYRNAILKKDTIIE